MVRVTGSSRTHYKSRVRGRYSQSAYYLTHALVGRPVQADRVANGASEHACLNVGLGAGVCLARKLVEDRVCPCFRTTSR